MKNKIIKNMKDLEKVLGEGDAPISETPPYFAECDNYHNVSIVTGAPDTFDFDFRKEPDNPWNEHTEKVVAEFNTKEKLRNGVSRELNELQQQFANSGFEQFYFLPANVSGLISWIFLNNAMAAGFNSKGRPMLYFGKMKNTVRVPEPGLVEYLLATHPAKLIGDSNTEHGFEIGHAKTYTMEGKGDQLPMSLPIMAEGILVEGKQSKNRFYHIVINCSGRRTDTKALPEYTDFSGNYVIEIPLSDHEKTGAYHGNVAVLYYNNKDGERGVVYVPMMLHEDHRSFVYEMFKTFFGERNVHTITDKDEKLFDEALNNLSMNSISTGEGRMIVSANNPWTNCYLEHIVGVDLLKVDMKAIALGGGGLQCCYTALNKNPLKIVK
ncbi:MAG: hypothetical protein ABIG89_04475 [Candidatus Woesearchaeota archaeon]